MSKLPTVYAFIDSQNLNLGVRSQGWRLDFKKFRLYLKNKYSVSRAYLIGHLNEKHKLRNVLVSNKKYSKLLGDFQQYIVRIDNWRNSLEYKKDQRRRSVETLGVSGRGDDSIIAKKRAKVNKRQLKNQRKSSKSAKMRYRKGKK